jgi:Kef-type K+ transport system membrane component KefB
MPDVSFTSLAVVLAVAFGSRLALGLCPKLRVPGVVLEIVLGIVVGPSVLGWADVDEPVQIVALIGLAFLLFLSGLELDLRELRGRLLRIGLVAFAVSASLALIVGIGLDAAGLVGDPLLVAVTLLATSLGLVIPVLKEGGLATTPFGQVLIVGATLGDFTAVVLLSLLFSQDAAATSTKLVLLAMFVLLVAVVGLSVALTARSGRLSAVLTSLQDTTAQIRVRGAVLLVVLFAVLAERTGLETILGAFVAGALLGLLDRDAMHTHPLFRLKLDAIGFGFLVPVFFVTSGLRFDLDALLADRSTLALVPIFLAALLLARGLPAFVYRAVVGSRRGVVAAGLLQATSLPVIVTATTIGVEIGVVTPATASAFITAGLLSALLFPALALSILRPAPAQRGSAVDQAHELVSGVM